MFELQLALWRSAFASAEAGLATAVTLSHRLPMLAVTPFAPTPDRVFEMQRMTAEKVAVALDGAIAATQLGIRIGGRAALGQVSAAEATRLFVEMADAAAGPARRRVRKNAGRLSKARRSTV